jgi:hypothetical protein
VAGSGERWRWTDQYGNQRLVHQDELRAALGGGTLPPYTLVWRPGMSEWRHAHDVPELMAVALSAQQGVVLNIPPPPLDVVAVQAEFEHRTVDVARDGEKVAAEEPPPPPLEMYAPFLARQSLPPMPSARFSASPPAARVAAAHAVDDDEAKTRVAQPVSPVVAAAAAHAADDDEAKTRVAQPVSPVVAAAAAHAADDDQAKTWVAKPAPAVGPPAKDVAGVPASAVEPHPARVSALPLIPAPHAVSPPPPSRKSLKPQPDGGLASLPPPPPLLRDGGLPVLGVNADGSEASASGEGDDAPGPLPPAPLLPSSDLLGIARDEHPRSGLSRDDELPSFPLESDAGQGASGTPAWRVKASRMLADAGQGTGDLVARLGALLARLRAQAAPAVAEAKEKLHDPKAMAAEAKENLRDPKARVAAGVGALVLVAFIVVAVLVVRSCGSNEEVETAPRPAASAVTPAVRADRAPAAVAARPPFAACVVSKGATRIAPKVSKDVPIEVSASRGDARAFIGFAADPKSAIGFSLDTTSLAAKSEFSANTAGKLRGVVPMAESGAAAFAVDADGSGDKLQGWRTAAGDPLAVVGYVSGGLATAPAANQEPKVLWPLVGDDPAEALRVIDLSDKGHAVVFRRRGEIFAGLIDRSHAARGPLVRLTGAGAPAGAPVGAPAIATNGRLIAVVFADRIATSDPWEIRLGMATAPAVLPTGTARFQIPAGGAGGAAMAPTLAGLADGRWILVWTEGGGGDYDVRGQTLGPDLAPIGPAFTVSKPGSNAGQAAVAVGANSGVIAYLSQAGEGYELWAAALSCR